LGFFWGSGAGAAVGVSVAVAAAMPDCTSGVVGATAVATAAVAAALALAALPAFPFAPAVAVAPPAAPWVLLVAINARIGTAGGGLSSRAAGGVRAASSPTVIAPAGPVSARQPPAELSHFHFGERTTSSASLTVIARRADSAHCRRFASHRRVSASDGGATRSKGTFCPSSSVE
jgi:hypothetical protein